MPGAFHKTRGEDKICTQTTHIFGEFERKVPAGWGKGSLTEVDP